MTGLTTSMASPASNASSSEDTALLVRPSERTALLIAYLMYAGMFVGIPLLPIVGAVINHLKLADYRQPDHANHWIASHHLWLSQTFWWSLGLSAVFGVAAVTIVMLPLAIGGFLLLAIWYIYRIVRGALALLEDRPLPVHRYV